MASRSSKDQLAFDLEFGAPAVVPGRDELLPWLGHLLDTYLAGKLGGTTHEVFPEVDKGSRENYLYFTLAPALNFQRNSEALWRSALATYSDPATSFVFFPENTGRGVEAYQQALVLHRLALQPSKHTDIWFRLSQTLAGEFDADPRVFVKRFSGDVPSIKAYVQDNKKLFPYLSGPKLLNYWLYMLTCFTDVALVQRDQISIIPDLHVCRASARLGLVTSDEAEDARAVAARWDSLLAGTGMAPSDLHAPLWRWSRAGFPDITVL